MFAGRFNHREKGRKGTGRVPLMLSHSEVSLYSQQFSVLLGACNGTNWCTDLGIHLKKRVHDFTMG